MLLPFVLAAATAGAAPGARVAVVVGSNAAIEGRSALRYAANDARALADVLVSAGGFDPKAVTLIVGGGPGEVLAALDAARAKTEAAGDDGLLLFYYSGHADDAALYPAGAALPLSDLKARLGAQGPGVRVGIIDACRGGGWTQAKGLHAAPPFDVGLGALSSEGTALLSSSSGLEDAHEAESLQGSFFTHYLVAGLRGAAEANDDGFITLSEAFAYANRYTIRDTATRAPTPQHPSFDLRLRGRQDVALTSLANADTHLAVAQEEGPLEVVQLATGVVVAEAAPGARVLKLALPPGPYLVRRVRGGEVLSREVQVKSGETTRVDEGSLALTGSAAVAAKGGESVHRGPLRLAVDVGIAPLDAFQVGVTTSVEGAWFFGRTWAWRFARVTWNFSTETGLATQLSRDFSVLPTSLVSVGAVVDTAVRAEPVLLAGDGAELRAFLDLGPAVAFVRTGDGRVSTALPGVSGAAGLLWIFTGRGITRGLGLRLALQDTTGFTQWGAMHLVALTLGVGAAMGAPR